MKDLIEILIAAIEKATSLKGWTLTDTTDDNYVFHTSDESWDYEFLVGVRNYYFVEASMKYGDDGTNHGCKFFTDYYVQHLKENGI